MHQGPQRRINTRLQSFVVHVCAVSFECNKTVNYVLNYLKLSLFIYTRVFFSPYSTPPLPLFVFIRFQRTKLITLGLPVCARDLLSNFVYAYCSYTPITFHSVAIHSHTKKCVLIYSGAINCFLLPSSLSLSVSFCAFSTHNMSYNYYLISQNPSYSKYILGLYCWFLQWLIFYFVYLIVYGIV